MKKSEKKMIDNKAPLSKEEILKMASGSDRDYDEREELVDLNGGDMACLIGMIMCSLIAALKAFVFKSNPYDIFTVQFTAYTAYYFYNYKKLGKKKYLTGFLITGALALFSTASFVLTEVVSNTAEKVDE